MTTATRRSPSSVRGPSGLTCAYDLALDGYDITVFEKEKRLGGMLTLGIPSYRLEKDVLEAEIDVIRAMGVKFETGVEIGKDISLAELREKGFDAFFIAIGASSGRKLGIQGEEARGVMSGVDFLRKTNLSEDTGVKGKVVVIGGGNVAIDVARSSVRLGEVSQVELFCLESRSQMPAPRGRSGRGAFGRDSRQQLLGTRSNSSRKRQGHGCGV